jgi:predicted small lipoprotein YifL
MKRDPARLILAACAALTLGSCGQKGPLYLPGDPSEIQTEIPPEPAEPAPAEDPDETDDEIDYETDAADQ